MTKLVPVIKPKIVLMYEKNAAAFKKHELKKEMAPLLYKFFHAYDQAIDLLKKREQFYNEILYQTTSHVNWIDEIGKEDLDIRLNKALKGIQSEATNIHAMTSKYTTLLDQFDAFDPPLAEVVSMRNSIKGIYENHWELYGSAKHAQFTRTSLFDLTPCTYTGICGCVGAAEPYMSKCMPDADESILEWSNSQKSNHMKNTFRMLFGNKDD